MTWADRLFRLASGDRSREIIEQLRAAHARSVAQGIRLTAAAAQAPTAGAENDLRGLAAARDAQTARLAAALAERGAAPGAEIPAPILNGAARNHWARLVAALEACREARAQIARTQPRLVEADASLDGLLQSLDSSWRAESLSLRALIARADPQALD